MAKNINVTLTLQDKYSARLSDAAAATLLFNKQLTAAKTVASGFKSVMGVMEKAAVGAATVVVGAGAALTKEALSSYQEYEAALNEVAAVQGISAQTEAYKELNDQIKEAAKNVQATTYTEAAQAAYYMSLAGWRDEEIEVGMTPVMQAVKISGADTQEVSDALTDSMTALGLTADYTQQFVDLATAVQSATNTDMLSLQNALIKDGAAYMASYSESAESDIDKVKDLMAMTGVLASAGIKDTKAGTTIQSLLSRFYKSGNNEAQKGLEALGISMYDTEGNAKSMLEVFTEMDSALEGLSQAERNDALFKIGGTRYTSALNTIMDAFTEVGENGQTAIEKVNEAMAESDGAAERYLDTLYSGYSGGLEQLKAEWENFKTDLGEMIAPYALEYIQEIRDILPEALEYADQKIPVIAEKIEGLFETAKSGVSWLMENGESLIKTLGAAYIGMGVFRTGVSAVDTVYKLSNFLKIGSGARTAGNVVRIAGGAAGTAGASLGTGSVLSGSIGNILGTGGAAAAGGSFSLGAVLAPTVTGLGIAAGAGILLAGAFDGYRKYQDKKAKEEAKQNDKLIGANQKLTTATQQQSLRTKALEKAEGIVYGGSTGKVVGEGIRNSGTADEGVSEVYGPFQVEEGAELVPPEYPGVDFDYNIKDKDREVQTEVHTAAAAADNGIGYDFGIGELVSVLGDNFASLFESLDKINSGQLEVKTTADLVAVGVAAVETAVGGVAAAVVAAGETVAAVVGSIVGIVGGIVNSAIRVFNGESLTEGAQSGYVGSDGSVEYGGSGTSSPLQNDWSAQEADQFGYALGTNYFQGGQTAVNENGYEIIDLPRGAEIKHNALGSGYFEGGKTTVNEDGYEIMDLPRGTRIIPHQKSRQIVEGRGNGRFVININIDNVYGEDDRMVNRIGNTVAEKLAALM